MPPSDPADSDHGAASDQAAASDLAAAADHAGAGRQGADADRPVALVTGSTSGIGAAVARRLARDGHTVIIHSRQSADAGRALAAELGRAIYLQADLAQDEDRSRLIADVLDRCGRLDVLVNNAGISQVIPHADLDSATPGIWHALYEVNVVAPFRLVTAAAPALAAAATRGGRAGAVVNISSHAGVRPKGASIPYSATKAALNHVTRLLALTLAPDIRVNAVAPGLVDTPMTATWVDAQRLWRERSPMQRPASPDDIAAIVAMLVASDYLSGEVIIADGGLNLT